MTDLHDKEKGKIEKIGMFMRGLLNSTDYNPKDLPARQGDIQEVKEKLNEIIDFLNNL